MIVAVTVLRVCSLTNQKVLGAANFFQLTVPSHARHVLGAFRLLTTLIAILIAF